MINNEPFRVINLATLQSPNILAVDIVWAHLMAHPLASSLSLGLSPSSCAQAVRWDQPILGTNLDFNLFVRFK